MGLCHSKSNVTVSSPVKDETSRRPSSYKAIERSLKQRKHSQSHRQTLAWHRDNVDINEVYDVLEIIGQGSMGEVTVVQKKHPALSIVERRVSGISSVSDTRMSAPEEWGDIPSERENVTGKNDDIASSPFFVTGVPPPLLSPLALPLPPPLSTIIPPSPPTTPNTNRKFACKTVNTTRMKPTEMAEFLNEITILRDLDHPNIIQLFEVYKVKRKLWIVTELCSGGDLSSRVAVLSEVDAAVITEQILRAVHYMHKRNVCHRDIKLENVMFVGSSCSKGGSNNNNTCDVKLVDFGLSNRFTKGEKMSEACGTIYTAAPELLLGEGSTELTDIWAVGVVAWILLSRSYPFLREMNDLRDDSKLEKLTDAKFVFGPEWAERKISRYGREFVARCLRKHPGSRWCADAALKFVQNRWVPHLEKDQQREGGGAMMEGKILSEEMGNVYGGKSGISFNRSCSFLKRRIRMNAGTLQGLQKFTHHGELKKTILMTMAYTMDKSNLQELREIFTVLDRGSTGTIDLAELKQALKGVHYCPATNTSHTLDDTTIETLFRGIDMDNSGEIHYMEFLAAVAESQGLITRERLAEVFDRLDSDGKGYISKNDLRNVLGRDYNEDLVNRMIYEADYKKNGQIDYDEFLRLMFERIVITKTV